MFHNGPQATSASFPFHSPLRHGAQGIIDGGDRAVDPVGIGNQVVAVLDGALEALVPPDGWLFDRSLFDRP